MDKLLRALAICDPISPTIALVRGGQAFRVRRGQGMSGNNIKNQLRLFGIKTRSLLVDPIRNEIHLSVAKKHAERTARILSELGLDWW